MVLNNAVDSYLGNNTKKSQQGLVVFPQGIIGK